jgi:CheY-like chemotaxis protein
MERSTERLRVLVADDHPVFRRGMRAMLGVEPDTELAGETMDGEEAVWLALEVRPDVILMDLNMPRATGIEATHRSLEANPDTAILTLTMFEDDKSIFAAMRRCPRLRSQGRRRGPDATGDPRRGQRGGDLQPRDHAAPDGILRNI